MSDLKLINGLNNYKILEYHIPYFLNKVVCTIDPKNSTFRDPIKNLKHFKIKIDTVIRLSLKKNDKINFAFLYGTINSGKFEMKYYCIGNNLISCDGEYRKKFLDPTSFVLYENYLQFTYYIELLFTNRLISEYFELEYECLPYNDIKREEIIEIAKKIYTILFLLDMFKLEKKQVENHINKSYYKTLYNPKDLELFLRIKSQDKPIMEHFEKHFNEAQFYLEIGHKQLPSSSKYFINYENKLVNFIKNVKLENVGKEIYFSYLINEIVINNIYPGFPILADYFIHNSNINFFNNSSMVEKIKLDLLNKKNKKHIKKFINYKKGVTYISEYIGRTIKDAIYLQRDELYRIYTGDILNDHGMFYKYVFEALYGLNCMNMYAGIIHTDLHINNATIFEMYKGYCEYSPYTHIANGHIMYNIATSSMDIMYQEHTATNDGEFNDDPKYKANMEQVRDAVRFIFPYTGSHFGIIDFSRGYLHRKRLITDEGINPQTRKNILTIQNLRITKLFNNLFPDLKTNDFVYFLNTDNSGMYEFLFDTICALDVYYFFSQFHIYLKNFFSDLNNVKEYDSFINHKLAGRPDLKISKDEKLDLLKDISDKAFKYMDERLKQLDVSKPQLFENYKSSNFAKSLILSGIFDRYSERLMKPSVVIHNLSYDMLKNEAVSFDKEAMDANKQSYRNYYEDNAETPAPFILTIEEKKRREAEAAKMAIEKKEYYEKLARDFNDAIEKARDIADGKLKGTYVGGASRITTEQMDNYTNHLHWRLERFVKQNEYGPRKYDKGIELVKKRIDDFDRTKYISQTATNFALNDIYNALKRGGADSVKQQAKDKIQQYAMEKITTAIENGDLSHLIAKNITTTQKQKAMEIINDYKDNEIMDHILTSDEQKRIYAIAEAVLGGEIDMTEFLSNPDKFIFIDVIHDHNIATYKLKELSEKMVHSDIEKDVRDAFIIKTESQKQQEEELIKSKNIDDENIVNKLDDLLSLHPPNGVMMGPKLAIYNKGLKLKNTYFAENFQYGMVDPKTKELIPYEDMRQKNIPGFHTNNIMKANYNFRIVSIINEQNHNMNEFGLRTPRFSDDTYRNKQCHPILLKYLDDVLSKYEFNKESVRQAILEDADELSDEDEDVLDDLDLSNLLTK